MAVWEWLRARLFSAQVMREIDDELQLHLDMQIADYERSGLPRQEARRLALRRFGDMKTVMGNCCAVYQLANPLERRNSIMESVLQDLRYAVRSLARQPSFSVLAIATLAVGIAANTIIFSAVSSTLLHPVPFAGGDRFISIANASPAGVMTMAPIPRAVHAWREYARSLDGIATYGTKRFLVHINGEPQRLVAGAASVELLPFLGIQPILGRRFFAADTIPGQDRVVLLTERLWKQRFGAAKDVLGTTISLDGESHTVIGVLPGQADAFFEPSSGNSGAQGSEYALWVPGANMRATVARLRPGVSIADAVRDLERVHARLGFDPDRPEGWPLRIRRPIDEVARDLRIGLWVLMGAVGFVLLVACVNVANMVLARGLARGHELAMRTALGAARGRVIRQLLVESVLLTGIATAIALGVAAATLGVVRSRLPVGFTELHAVRIDTTVLIVTAGIALVTGVVFGLVPTGQLRMLDLARLLTHGHRSGFAAPSKALFRGALVAVEVALATVLFAGAALMVNSLLRLQRNDPGFDPTNVVSFAVSLPSSRYPNTAGQRAFFEMLLERLRQAPQLRRAALGSIGGRGFMEGAVTVEGATDSFPNRGFIINFISDDYFSTLGIAIPAGREFVASEITVDETAVMVNENFARTYWPGEQAVGKRFRFGSAGSWHHVLGVVGTVELSGLRSGRNSLHIYQPYPTLTLGRQVVVVQARGDPRDVIPLVKDAVWTLDADLPIRDITVASKMLDDAIARPRFNAFLLIGFAITALALAAVGVYGVVSLTLQHRVHELGVRVALGAQSRDLFELMLSYGMRPAGVGVVLGLLGAIGLTRFLRTLLFEVEPTDPVTYVVVVVVLATTAFVACYAPARRASKLDPVEVLRYQ